MKNKLIIGRLDKADFPDLELFEIDVKIDTGAYTSSFHCHDIKVENNKLTCKFLDPEHPNYDNKEFVFKNFKDKKVKSSNGMVEHRYTIKTSILIFNQLHEIDLTLTNRENMKNPVLLGRKFLSKRFIVDVSRKNLSYKKILLYKE